MTLVILIVGSLIAPVSALAAPSAGPGVADALFARAADAARAEGVDVPDAATLVGELRVVDLATGEETVTHLPLTDALAHLDAVAATEGVHALQGDARAEDMGPAAGVGSNVHGYAHFAAASPGCDARRYTVHANAGSDLDTVRVENPLNAPVSHPTVWGGNATVVTGDDYAFGVHLFYGVPEDVNVNTAAPPAEAVLDVNVNMRAAGGGQLVEVNTPIRFGGTCVGAIATGILAFNGVLVVNEEATPALGVA